jgi:hypothetical protein
MMFGVALVVGVAVYWISLRTLPDDGLADEPTPARAAARTAPGHRAARPAPRRARREAAAPRSRPRLARAPRRAAPDAVAVASEPIPEPGADDGDDVLYVPVAPDEPDAHGRVVGVLGMLALVAIGGVLLALGAWQSIRLIGRLFDALIGA